MRRIRGKQYQILLVILCMCSVLLCACQNFGTAAWNQKSETISEHGSESLRLEDGDDAGRETSVNSRADSSTDSRAETSANSIAEGRTEDSESSGSDEFGSSSTENGKEEETTDWEKEQKIRAWMDTLTWEQKIGQLFVVRPDALEIETETSESEKQTTGAEGAVQVTKTMKAMLQKYPVGGICQFRENIVDPEQLKQFNEDLQQASAIPLFLAVDEEGGSVARLANHKAFDLPKYESAAAVGASGNRQDANEMGRTIGTYLVEYGFNLDFAPDADVNTNPNNPVIGSRAFSSDAKIAADMAAAAAEGFRKAGILPTFKHFPGHGDTAEDSHTALAVTQKTKEELQSCELLPFTSDTGMHAVMVGHIAVPNVTGDRTPASLSAELIALLPDAKETLLITDSLEMQAITETYSSGEAAVLALEAGCDLLLMPVDLPEAYDAVWKAVQDGRISKERIEESLVKIFRYKQEFAGLQLTES